MRAYHFYKSPVLPKPTEQKGIARPCNSKIIWRREDNKEHIKNLIETTIKECLKDIHISAPANEETSNHDDDKIDIMDGVLDFMTSFD